MADYYGEETIDRLPAPMPAQVYYGEQPYTFNQNWMAEAPPQPEQPVAVIPQPMQVAATQAVPMTDTPANASVTPIQGMPGTMTTQFQGEAVPATRYVPSGPETRAQPLPAWYTNYEKERAAFLDEQRQKDELYRMLQNVKAQSLPEAAKAIQAARQLQGQLEFASAIKAGVPMPQALAQYASAFSPGQTTAMASLAKATQQGFQPTVEEVGGQKLYRTGLNRYQFAPPSNAAGEASVTIFRDDQGKEIGRGITQGGKLRNMQWIKTEREPRSVTVDIVSPDGKTLLGTERITPEEFQKRMAQKEVENAQAQKESLWFKGLRPGAVSEADKKIAEAEAKKRLIFDPKTGRLQ